MDLDSEAPASGLPNHPASPVQRAVHDFFAETVVSTLSAARIGFDLAIEAALLSGAAYAFTSVEHFLEGVGLTGLDGTVIRLLRIVGAAVFVTSAIAHFVDTLAIRLIRGLRRVRKEWSHGS